MSAKKPKSSSGSSKHGVPKTTAKDVAELTDFVRVTLFLFFSFLCFFFRDHMPEPQASACAHLYVHVCGCYFKGDSGKEMG